MSTVRSCPNHLWHTPGRIVGRLMKNFMAVIRLEWRDLLTAALSLLAACLCLAASVYRLIRDKSDILALVLIVLGLVSASIGLALARRKIREIDDRS